MVDSLTASSAWLQERRHCDWDVIYANPQSVATNTDEPLMTSQLHEELYSDELQDFVQAHDPLARLEASVSYADTEALRTTINADLYT